MHFILKLRYVFFGVFLILFVVCAVLIPKVKINYDGSKYLDDDMPSKQAMLVLEEEFGLFGYLELMIEDITVNDAYVVQMDLNQVENVALVEFYAQDENFYKEQSALFKIYFETGNYDFTTHIAIDVIRDALPNYTIFMKGESLASSEYNRVLEKEIIRILIVLIPIVLIILIITTTSWFEPTLFILVVLISIIINMGTNIIFDDISYMTHATSGILQLAICMDYSVILIHRYRKVKKTVPDTRQAIVQSMKDSFLPILGSSLTTIAGFVAIMFMQYKIGLDIGMVLAKGTIISILTAFLLMPGLILVFEPILRKTEHKKLFTKNRKTHQFLIKMRFVIPVIALLIIGASFYLQSTNTFLYGESTFVEDSKTLKTDYKKIANTFGINNQFVFLVPKDDLMREGALVASLQSIASDQGITVKAITSTTLFYTQMDRTTFSYVLQSYGLSAQDIDAMITIFDTMSLIYARDTFSIVEVKTFIETTDLLSPAEKQALLPFTMQIDFTLANLTSENYNRVLLIVDLKTESEATFVFVEAIEEAASTIYDDEYHLVGESATIYDMKELGKIDVLRIAIYIIVLVFIVIALSFRSISIPIILILTIQGAIWINMAIPALMNTNLMFMGYIIVSCIMLGATIDYAILYANRYLENRISLSPKESMVTSFEETKTTVLTSGLILIFAGYALAFISSIPSIAIFGDLIGRGGIASTLVVLLVLPPTMLIFDKWILKTTKKRKHRQD